MAKMRSGAVVAMACLFPLIVSAEEKEKEKQPSITLDKVVVKGKKKSLVEIDNKAATTQEVLPKELLDASLNAAQTGSYKALEMLPSVNVQTADAYGLALGKTLRLRGAFSGDSFLRNIEGLPVSSHGGGGDFIDFENVESVSVYRGAIPANRSFGVRSMTGGIDLSILWPQDTFGGTVKQAVGGSGFRRTYARLDSGLLATGTKVFVSYSKTSADKWRGEGGQPEERENLEIGISQALWKDAKLDLFAVYHHLKQHDFRGLTYAQAQDLGTYGSYDYNATLTGNAATDMRYYYDFTKQDYRDRMVMMNFETKVPGGGTFTFKPYYWYDRGTRWSGSNGYVGIGDPTTQPQQYGFTTQYDFKVGSVDLSLGYWHQTIEDTLPPPLGTKKYTINYLANGSYSYTFAGWASLASEDQKLYDSPYISAQTKLGNTTLTGSLKYMHIKDPSRQSYSTTGLPDVSYDEVFSYNPAYDASTSTPDKVWTFWEPAVSVNHEFSPETSGYFAYGSGYEFNNWSGLSSSYTTYKAQFQAAGISFLSLWNKLDIERFHNFDLGLRFKGNTFGIAPTIYYAINKNKTVSVYDAVVGASYSQSDASATLYGAELELTAQPGIPVPGNLSLYLSGSYNHYTYDENIRNASSNIVQCGGKQMADTPKFMAKAGATYTLSGFTASPMVRYLGARYGDVENKQKVDGYVLADLHLGYHTGPLWALKDLAFTFSALNLFDKRYIANINTSDFTLSTSTSYYPGAPRTLMAGMTAKF